MVSIDELRVGGDAAAWAALGFSTDGGGLVVGNVRISCDPGATGLAGWSLHGISGTDLDGLPTEGSGQEPRSGTPSHPLGVTAIDHVVAMTPDLERTVPALESAGLDLRRIRDEPTPAGAPRQAFFRLGEVILEVVQIPDGALDRSGGQDGPAFFWGLAFTCPDIDVATTGLGEHCSEVRDAVQPGRRIATLKRSAGLPVPVALMTPPPGK